MDESVDVKSHIFMRTIAKQIVYVAFDLATLFPIRQQHHVNTRFGYRPKTKYTCTAVTWCSIGSYCLDRGLKYGWTPYLCV